MASSSKSTLIDVKSDSYGDSLVLKLQELRIEDSLCDFTVQTEDLSINVHGVILAATSDYFRAMLLGAAMKETRERLVNLKGISKTSLRTVIDFIYSGKMFLDWQNITDILNAASHLQIASALDACSNYLIKKLNFDTAEEILSISDTYSLKKVSDYYHDLILKNFEDFSKSDKFRKTSSQELIQLLSSDKLIISSERFLFDYVTKWVSLVKAERLTEAARLMDTIRFSLLPDNVLVELLNNNICKVSQITNYINEGRLYHQQSISGHPILTKRCILRTPTNMIVCTQHGARYRPLSIFAINMKLEKIYRLPGDVNTAKDSRVATMENFLYIYRLIDAGGGASITQLLRFDARHLTICQMKTANIIRMDAAFFIIPGLKIMICGGMTDLYEPLVSVEVYDAKTNVWNPASNLPLATHSHSGASLSNRIFISGGVINKDPSNQLLELVNGIWQAREPMKFPRRLHQMIVHRSQIFVAGGTQSRDHLSTIHLESYDANNNQWTILCETMSGRSIGHFISINNDLYSIGREHSKATENDIWKYYDEDDQWKRFSCISKSLSLSTSLASTLAFNINDDQFSSLESSSLSGS